MGEQPLFTTSAHVFEIDPDTKKSWLPSSKQAVPVSFYCDPLRSHHRIISVDGTKVIINSSITQNMHFMKTSAKFGQWSDPRANTVYGLGFSSENDLNKFAEKFNETKATISTKSTQQSSAIDTNGYNTDSTESKNEITSSSLNNSKVLWRMEAELSNLKSRNEEISILLQNYRDDNKQLKSKVQRLEEQKNTLTTEACLKIHIITNLFCNQKDLRNEKMLDLEEQQNINLQTIEKLRKELQGQEILEEENERLTSQCQDLIRENELLKKQISSLTSNGDGELTNTKLMLKLKTLQGTLGNRIGDLQSVHAEISSLLNPQEYSC